MITKKPRKKLPRRGCSNHAAPDLWAGIPDVRRAPCRILSTGPIGPYTTRRWQGRYLDQQRSYAPTLSPETLPRPACGGSQRSSRDHADRSVMARRDRVTARHALVLEARGSTCNRKVLVATTPGSQVGARGDRGAYSRLAGRRLRAAPRPAARRERRSHGRKAAALPGFKLCAHQFRPVGGQPVISGSVDRRKRRYRTPMLAGGPGPSAIVHADAAT